MSAYSYSAEDRLIHPLAYMYTPFEGAPFFDGYAASRRAAMEFLKPLSLGLGPGDEMRAIWSAVAPLVPSAGGLTGEPVGTPRVPAGALDSSEAIDTRAAALALIYHWAGAREATPDRAWFAAEKLHRKFEIRKQLFERYEPGFGAGAGRSDRVLIYALVSLALNLAYLRSRRLKFLNTAVKLNDVLASVPSRFDASSAAPAWLSLALEAAQVRELASSRGVPLAPA